MRPRTKAQKEVAALSHSLPAISTKQEAFGLEHSHEYIGYFSVGEVWCTHCGKFTGELDPTATMCNGEEYVCPFCGAKLKIKRSTKKKYSEKRYFSIITTCNNWQVIRHIVSYWNVRKGYEPNGWCKEAVQIWLREDGTEVIVARPCTMHGGDSWDLWKPMEIRVRHSTYYDYNGSKYNIWADNISPEYKVLPILKRNGFCLRAAKEGMPPCRLALALFSDNEAEFLVKTGQYQLLNYFKYKRGISINHYKPAIKICIRNNYKVKDGSMWVDYIDLLEYFHLDTHNPHYVCPKNLKAEHDRLLARKRRAEARKAEEAKRLEAVKWEEQYRAEKAKFFGICFGNENITITVIQSVADMADEGKAMHHCVFDMGYYNKPDSLILTARDPAGNRIETIEISLKTFSVVQSRAKCNGTSERHGEILELINQNINLIKQAA